MFKVECPRCGGSGILPQHKNVIGGTCFLCDGKGYVMRKTKPSTPRKWFAVLAKEFSGHTLKIVSHKQASSADALHKSMIKQLKAVKPQYQVWNPDTIVIREEKR